MKLLYKADLLNLQIYSLDCNIFFFNQSSKVSTDIFSGKIGIHQLYISIECVYLKLLINITNSDIKERVNHKDYCIAYCVLFALEPDNFKSSKQIQRQSNL